MNREVKKDAKLPAIVIHAGAARFPKSKEITEKTQVILRRIVNEAYERLAERKISALDAVVWAVCQLEDEPLFNAGTGGRLQSDGVARLSAGLMDGQAGHFSGVVNIEGVRNPIQVARSLLKEGDRVLAGEGATAFARKNRFETYDPITPHTLRSWQEASRGQRSEAKEVFGTVGAVAVDVEGRLAAGTSTGGKGMEIVGRMSDSATVAGNYASLNAAVSVTGNGEQIVDAALAARIVTRVDDGATLSSAFERSFSEMREAGRLAGAIGVDSMGNVVAEKSTPHLRYALRTPSDEKGYP